MTETIYSIMDFCLPFEWASHTFMKNAFLAVLMICPLFGILGTMVVAGRMAFFADSLSHSTFTGIALGALLHLSSPRISVVLFAVAFAVFITYIKRRSRASTDTVISVFSSAAVALGLMLMSQGGSFGKFSSFMIGDLLSINKTDLFSLLIVGLATGIIWLALFNPLLLVSVNESFAKSRGIKTVFVESLFAMTIAVVVAISIEWVGVLIINSLLVLPAAGAANVAIGVRQYHFFAVVIALFSGIVGLILAYYLGMAAGAVIALTAAMIFFATLGIKRT